jgi:hypothetical protein
LLPLKDKKRYLALTQEATTSEIFDANNDILSWQRSQSLVVDHNKQATKSQALPPVRGSAHSSILNEKSDNDSSERHDLKHYKILSANQNLKLSELRAKLKVSQLPIKTRKSKGSESTYFFLSKSLCQIFPPFQTWKK